METISFKARKGLTTIQKLFYSSDLDYKYKRIISEIPEYIEYTDIKNNNGEIAVGNIIVYTKRGNSYIIDDTFKTYYSILFNTEPALNKKAKIINFNIKPSKKFIKK